MAQISLHREIITDSVAGFLARSGLPQGRWIAFPSYDYDSDNSNRNVLHTVAETASAFHGIPFYLCISTIKSQGQTSFQVFFVKQS